MPPIDPDLASLMTLLTGAAVAIRWLLKGLADVIWSIRRKP